MTRPSVRALASLCLLSVVMVGAWQVPATGQTGPRITLDRPEVGPGQPVLVTFEGFDSSFVDFVVCGNLAYRGAADCNVTAGVSKETASGGAPKVVQVIAHPPPAHCPCIVRASGSTGEEFAVAPIVIVGHPVGDLVGVPDGPLVEVDVETASANRGLWSTLRAALGGPTRYEATVAVRNTSTETLTRLELHGSVGHWLDDDAATLDLHGPEALEPGQTWTQTVVAELSAPSVGTYRFEVVASGAGSSMTASHSVSRQPLLLWFLAAVLVVDVVITVFRQIARRRARREKLTEELVAGPGDAEIELLDVVDLTQPTASSKSLPV